MIGIPLKTPGFHVVEIASPRLGQALLGEARPRYVATTALVTNLSVLVVISLLLLVLTWWVLWRTPFGLRLRSCGESPSAAESLGVAVMRYKFAAVLVSGAMAGLAGGFLAMVASRSPFCT